MLVKRYINELGSTELENRLLQEQPYLVVSELGRAEFISTMGRKVRQRQLPPHASAILYARLLEDVESSAIALLPLDSVIVQQAVGLMRQLTQALTTLDALHLATALQHKAGILFTADAQLARAAEEAGLATWGA